MQEMHTINHVSLMSGLRSRTIRNYMKMGFIEGEMINGVWHFSAEAVGGFLCKSKCRPSHPGEAKCLDLRFSL